MGFEDGGFCVTPGDGFASAAETLIRRATRCITRGTNG